MASEQFILEMHEKLHPGSDVHDIGGLTGADLKEITDIIDYKHAIRLSSKWINLEVVVDLRVLEAVLTSASLSAYAGLEEQNKKQIGDFSGIGGIIDQEKIQEWEMSVAHYEEQLAAVKSMEKIIEGLRNETHKPDFYMRGVQREDANN